MRIDNYQNALRQFSQDGNRYATIPDLTRIGKMCGLSAEDIIADARDMGVADRDADIRRMWNGATVTANTSVRHPWHTSYGRVSQVPKRKTHPSFVRNVIAKATDVSIDTLANLSPTNVRIMTDRQSAVAMLSAMFSPDEIILVGTMKKREAVKSNLRPLREWLADPHLLNHEQVKINPFTGREEDGGSGKTFCGKKCVADYRFALLEFDSLSLECQQRFWCEVIKRNLLPVVAVVFSGNKSLHGLVRVDAPTEAKWNEYRDRLMSLVCSAPEPQYQADDNALKNPTCAIRLAGVERCDGKRQELLYLNPTAGRSEGVRHG